MPLTDQTIEALVRLITGESDPLDFEESTVHDFMPDYELDPVARFVTEPGEQSFLSDIEPGLTRGMSRARARHEAIASQAQTGPVDPAIQVAGHAGVARAEERLESWFDKHGGGPNGDFSGFIPTKALAPIEGGRHFMKPSAAAAYKAMQKAAKRDGVNFSITDSYRDYNAQVALKKAKPSLAATPGHSNHGWGLALDINVNDPETYKWLKRNGKKFGFEQPMSYEPWHWEYEGGFKGAVKAPKPRRKLKPAQQEREFVDVVNLPADPLVTLGMPILSTMGEIRAAGRARNAREYERATGLGFIPKPRRNIFQEAAAKYGLDARLLGFVARQESGFTHHKEPNSAGAVGPMQVIPKWHPSWDSNKLANNYRYNVMAGAAILASYLNAAKEHALHRQQGVDVLRLGLAFYNAGPNSSEELLRERMRLYSDPILAAFSGKAA